MVLDCRVVPQVVAKERVQQVGWGRQNDMGHAGGVRMVLSL